MTTKELFSREHDIPLPKVQKLVKLAKRYFDANEKYSNGDDHPHGKSKSECSRLWGEEVDRITKEIYDLMEPHGFTDVVSTGLGPTLIKGQRYVEIPYDSNEER